MQMGNAELIRTSVDEGLFVKPGYKVRRESRIGDRTVWHAISSFNGKTNDDGWFQPFVGYGLDSENPGEFAVGIYRLDTGMQHPLHLHTETAEFYYVLAGSAHFVVGDMSRQLDAGNGLYIPRGMPHAIECNDSGVEILYVFEAGEGQSLGTVWLDAQ